MDVIHVQARGDAFEGGEVIGLEKRHDVRPLRQYDLGQRVCPALAAVEDVVAHEPHRTASHRTGVTAVVAGRVGVRFPLVRPISRSSGGRCGCRGPDSSYVSTATLSRFYPLPRAGGAVAVVASFICRCQQSGETGARGFQMLALREGFVSMAGSTGKRIGELLSQMVPLSGHDIDEILHEQSATRKSFGDIALSMGLCRPEHIWKAWCGQLLIDTDPRRIDLERFGIDSQAVGCIPHETARRLNIIPVRV